MTKTELRNIFSQKRLALSEADYRRYNNDLADQFFKFVRCDDIRVLHSYIPMTDRKEPNTWAIIDRLMLHPPTLRISFPRIVHHALEHYYFEGKEMLKQNDWGVTEPIPHLPTPIASIDMVIVPLLAFNTTLHRVGYGKGYYDRFLADCRPDCKKIGLSFFEPVAEIDDLNQHDVPLNHVITPEGIY